MSFPGIDTWLDPTDWECYTLQQAGFLILNSKCIARHVVHFLPLPRAFMAAHGPFLMTHGRQGQGTQGLASWIFSFHLSRHKRFHSPASMCSHACRDTLRVLRVLAHADPKCVHCMSNWTDSQAQSVGDWKGSMFVIWVEKLLPLDSFLAFDHFGFDTLVLILPNIGLAKISLWWTWPCN